MQSDIVGSVLSVVGRPTKSGKTIFDVAFSDGTTYTTFNGELAQKANALINQTVSARVEVSQKGQYTNYNIHDIAPQGQLAPQAMPVAGGTPVGVPTAAAPAGIPMQQQETQAVKDARIARTSAVKYAQELVSSLFQGAGPEALDQALECADKAGAWFYGKLTGPQAASQEQQVVPAERTPEAVADAVNAAAGTPVVATGAALPW